MRTLFQSRISVRRSPIHGYGVFADADLAAGDLIEECHIIEFSMSDAFINYKYDFKIDGQNVTCMPLGFGGIYNHSNSPNARFDYNEQTKLLVFTATQAIKRNEEIFIYYGKNWFAAREIPLMRGSLWYRIKKSVKQHYHLRRAVLLAAATLMSVMMLQDIPAFFALFK